MRSRAVSLLWICVTLLLALGIVVLYSAEREKSELLYRKGAVEKRIKEAREEAAKAAAENPELAGSGFDLLDERVLIKGKGGLPAKFWMHQLQWLAVSLAVMLLVMRFDYHNWRKYPKLTIGCYLAVAAMLVAVLFGEEIKGSRRWLTIGGMGIQPSEFAKTMTVIATATFLDRMGWRINLFWKGTLPALAIVGALAGLTLLEPDLGAGAVMGMAGAVVLLVAGMKWGQIGLFAAGAVAGLGGMVLAIPNRLMRMRQWIPDAVADFLGLAPALAADKDPTMYQLNHALKAIDNAGIWGLGYRGSLQQLSYLPEAHTDFIFCVGAEEFGLLFSLGVLGLFCGVCACGLRIAHLAPDRLGRLIAYGTTFLLFFQAMFNLCVVTGLIPTKGIALPFFSYGGTNLLSAMIMTGILLNVGRQTNANMGLPNGRARSRISRIFSNKGGN